MPNSKPNSSAVINRYARKWATWFVAATVAGMWMVPIIIGGAPPSAGRTAVAMTVAIAGVIAAAIGFFVGLVAGVRLPRD